MLGYPTAKRSVTRLLLASMLIAIMIMALIIPNSFAGINDLTATGYGIAENNLKSGWTTGNLGKTYEEGEWVPFQTIVKNVDWNQLNNLGAAFDFYDDGRFYDLVRNISVGVTELSSNQGFPGSIAGEPADISTLAKLNLAQRNPEEWFFDGFAPVLPFIIADGTVETQINVPMPGDTSSEMNEVRAFYVTKDQILRALDDEGLTTYGDPSTYPKTIVLYFQLHLSRTWLWNNLYDYDGDLDTPGEPSLATVYDGPPTDVWGGHVYTQSFLNTLMPGSYIYPGSSGHSYAFINNGEGGKKTIPIPDVQETTGMISGYKYDGEGNPLSGWRIVLRTDLYAIPDVEFATMTDGSGYFEFRNLPYNLIWEITEELQGTYTQIYPDGLTTGEGTYNPGGNVETTWWKEPFDLSFGGNRADWGWSVKLAPPDHLSQTHVDFANVNTGCLEIVKGL
jgi:hypothetical protein